jgi:hypothetical protein
VTMARGDTESIDHGGLCVGGFGIGIGRWELNDASPEYASVLRYTRIEQTKIYLTLVTMPVDLNVLV